MKRLIDLFLSVIALVILSPILIPIMIILKFTGEHYIFYAQDRIGEGGKVFSLLKFATMLKDSPNLGTGDITLKNDPRVLPFGKFLRKSKINELPQIINVLIGHMSLVGPRPLTPKNFDYYSEEVKEKIKLLKPGLTGIGSVVFRDEEFFLNKLVSDGLDHETAYREYVSSYKGKLEVWYFENRNIWIDFKLIVLTVFIIIKPNLNIRQFFNNLPVR